MVMMTTCNREDASLTHGRFHVCWRLWTDNSRTRVLSRHRQDCLVNRHCGVCWPVCPCMVL